jgi:hypothetical protein
VRYRRPPHLPRPPHAETHQRPSYTPCPTIGPLATWAVARRDQHRRMKARGDVNHEHQSPESLRRLPLASPFHVPDVGFARFAAAMIFRLTSGNDGMLFLTRGFVVVRCLGFCALIASAA